MALRLVLLPFDRVRPDLDALPGVSQLARSAGNDKEAAEPALEPSDDEGEDDENDK